MNYCLNPNCPQPHNPDGSRFCQTCGTKLILVERYRALNVLGIGGFGRTLLAEDIYQPSQPRCVIKQFYPQGQNNFQKAAKLFRAEAIRLEELGKHPQIPQLLAHFQQDNHLYIVQDFIDGQNLAQELAECGAFPEAGIYHLLRDLLPVLHFIHQGKVIHRDIKPDNIIRRQCDRKLVLVDFGAAKYATATALAKTGTTIGSAGYAAPEQTFGKARFASDIYSLGVTCIHLLTQLEPFDLYEPLESGLVWRPYLVNNPVSDELAHILDKMIQSSLKQRYHSAEAVIQDLSRVRRKYRSRTRQTTSPRTPNANLSLMTTLSGHSGEVHSLAFSPSGKTLASGSSDKTIKLWQISMAWEIRTLGGWLSKHSDKVEALAFSPNGKMLASGSSDCTIKLWEIRTGKQRCTLTDHSGVVFSLAFSGDSLTLASGSGDHQIKLWNPDTGRLKCNLSGHANWVRYLTFSPDGKTLVSGSCDDTIKQWDVLTGIEKQTLTGHSFSVFAITISPDGQTIASASQDYTIKLWTLASGKPKYTLKGHTNTVCAIAFSPDGKILASASWDNTIKLWDAGTGKQLCSLTNDSHRIYAIAFSPNGRTLASGGEDKVIKIWRVKIRS